MPPEDAVERVTAHQAPPEVRIGMVRTSSCGGKRSLSTDCRAPGAGLLAPMRRRYYDATTLGAIQDAYASPRPDRVGPQGVQLLVRAHRVSGSDEGGALEHMGRAARAREGCLGQWRERVMICWPWRISTPDSSSQPLGYRP